MNPTIRNQQLKRQPMNSIPPVCVIFSEEQTLCRCPACGELGVCSSTVSLNITEERRRASDGGDSRDRFDAFWKAVLF